MRGAPAPHPGGRINDTWFVGERYVLQRINGSVFADPPALMRNLERALAHCRRLLVAPLPTASGASFAIDDDGGVWRVFPRIASRAFSVLPDALVPAAGAAFGGFLRDFADFSGTLEPAIDGFHDLDRYLAELDDARRAADRAATAELHLADVLRGGFAPPGAQRVIHGDCKVDHVLFAPDADVPVALIDLDTLMRGDPAWDFGDLARSVFAAGEESAAPDISPARFERLCRGFFGAYGPPDDAGRFAQAPGYMSFMLGVRFLADHLRGDVYFKVARRGDNLARARWQMRLAQRFESTRGELAAALERAVAACMEARGKEDE